MKTLAELKELELAVFAAGVDGGSTTSDAIEDLRAAEAELGLQPHTTCPRWQEPAPEDAEHVLRLNHRETPAGRLLWRMGRDYWDTESAARRVAEHAAGEIGELVEILNLAYQEMFSDAVKRGSGQHGTSIQRVAAAIEKHTLKP